MASKDFLHRRARGVKSSTPAAVLLSVLPLLGAKGETTRLFNGNNLDGWRHVGAGSFLVRDGILETEGGMGLLWYTQKKVGHATVRVVFKMEGKEPDSGVFIRIPE